MRRPLCLAYPGQSVACQLTVTHSLCVHFKAVAQLSKLKHGLLIMRFRRWPTKWSYCLINTRCNRPDGIVDGVAVAVPAMQTLDINIEAVTQGREPLRFHLPCGSIYLPFRFPSRL